MKRSKDYEESGDEQSPAERVLDGVRVKRFHVINSKVSEIRSPTKRLSVSETPSRKSSPNLTPDLQQDHKRHQLDNMAFEKVSGSPISSTSSTPSNISVQQPSSQVLASDVHCNHLNIKAEESPHHDSGVQEESQNALRSPQIYAAEAGRVHRTIRRDERNPDLLGQLLATVTANQVKNEIVAKYFTNISHEALDGEIKTLLLNSDEWKKDTNNEGMSTRRFKRQNPEAIAVASDKLVWVSRYVPPSNRHEGYHGTRLAGSLVSGSGGSSSGREMNYELVTVRKKGGGRKLPTSSGRCGKCNTTDTPQWRYIHNGRFCNACYMRVKRWVDSNVGDQKLPSRARVDVTPEEDDRLARVAQRLVSEAFKALEGKC